MRHETCLLIDVAISSDRNVIIKNKAEKLRYKNLSTEIQRMWNMKCFVTPVIIGATGIVTKGLKDSVDSIDSMDSPQKPVALETLHIIRKVLQYET